MALHFAFFNWDVKEQFTRYRVIKKMSILLTGSPGAGFNCLAQ
jgi:DNA replication protein DnaC